MQWANEIDIERHLKGDLLYIYEECGEDVLLALLDKLKGMHINLKDGPVQEMKREYIREHGQRFSSRELAARLDVPVSFVEEAREDLDADAP
jgi:hypothetical protein